MAELVRGGSMTRLWRPLTRVGFTLIAAGCLAAAQPAPTDRLGVTDEPSATAGAPQPATPAPAGQSTIDTPPTAPTTPARENTAAPSHTGTEAPTAAPAPPPSAQQTTSPTPGAQLQLAPTPVATRDPGAAVCCPAPPQSEVWTAKDYATVIASMFAGTGGVLAFLVGLGAIWSNLRSTRKNNNQKTNEAELKSIEEKLDGFFGPYLQLSNTNKLIADELKQRHPEAPEMRILLLLLDPDWRGKISRGDTTLIDEIIGIDKSLLALIEDKAGMVDSAVQPYLYRAAAHFRMMLRAHEGLLDNELATYRSYVYPRQLDRIVQLEVDRLKARISLLRSAPMEQHPPMAPLTIPADLALGEWPPAGGPNSSA
jgi:hypothetical protein